MNTSSGHFGAEKGIALTFRRIHGDVGAAGLRECADARWAFCRAEKEEMSSDAWKNKKAANARVGRLCRPVMMRRDEGSEVVRSLFSDSATQRDVTEVCSPVSASAWPSLSAIICSGTRAGPSQSPEDCPCPGPCTTPGHLIWTLFPRSDEGSTRARHSLRNHVAACGFPPFCSGVRARAVPQQKGYRVERERLRRRLVQMLSKNETERWGGLRPA